MRVKQESKRNKFKNMELNSKPGTLEYNVERVDKIVNSGIVEK